VEAERVYRVLVVGDIMLDQYTHVKTERTAEEASIPVWDEVRQEYRLGGAANVAHNLKALGKEEVDVHLAGICGSSVVTWRLDQAKIKRERVMGQETMTKRRFVDQDGRYVMRLDNFRKFETGEIEFFEMMMNYWEQQFDCVIFSDYDKGTITPAVVDTFKKLAPLVIVDSKREDLRIFDGAQILKVNEKEYSAQVSSKIYPNFTEFFQYVVVTRGGDGATLIMCDHAKSVKYDLSPGRIIGESYTNHSEEFPVIRVMAKDVTGCGDTHTAAMAFCTLKTRDVRSAVKFANSCAAQVVQKFGTSVADL
jgi:rfaE bifunctional protein kinase chain/domain